MLFSLPFLSQIFDVVSTIFTALGTIVTLSGTILTNVIELVSGLVDVLTGVTDIWTVLTDFFGDFFTLIIDFFTDMIETIFGWSIEIDASFFVDTAFDFIASIFSGDWEGVRDAFALLVGKPIDEFIDQIVGYILIPFRYVFGIDIYPFYYLFKESLQVLAMFSSIIFIYMIFRIISQLKDGFDSNILMVTMQSRHQTSLPHYLK